MEYRGIRYTIRTRIERDEWHVAIHPGDVESAGKIITGDREQAEDAANIAKLPGSLRGFIFPLRCSLNINRGKGGIVVAKTFAKLTIGIMAFVVTTWVGTSSSRAYGDAPWCAVINLKGDVYWDCQYRTFEACYQLGNILAGNRGFCSLNPWPGPSQVVPYKHRKRHTQY